MNVFELVAKISLDSKEYQNGLEDAKKKTADLGNKLKGGMAAVGKVAAAGVTATTAAVGALSKSSLDSYASYEQLVGGVETLFGAGGQSLEEYAAANGKTVGEVRSEYNDLMDAQKTMLDNAQSAYTDAGMSANEYMETVTSFSASMIQSLGGDTKAAAEAANQAVVDMSDNANKMGTDMESIQNAYQGFAKQNYTMLDNLKLGYGGTKEEMQRLIDDANAVREANGEMGDLSIESFADVTAAIHTMQEEMGIAGTTHDEAATTIEGSVNTVKGAWSNLITGVADGNADMSGNIEKFVGSVDTAAGNIVPRLTQIMSGFGELATELGPVISEELPGIVEEVAPSLLEAGGSLLEGLIQGLITALPSLVGPAVDLVNQLVTFIIENLPLLIDGAVQIIIALAQGIAEALPDLIPTIVDAVILIGQTLIENIPLLLDAAGQIVEGLIEGILNCFPDLEGTAGDIVGIFSDTWEDIKTDLSEAWDNIKQTVTESFTNIKEDVTAAWEDIKGNVSEAVGNVKEDVSTKFNDLKEGVSETWDNIKSNISQTWDDIKSKASQAVEDVKSGISEKFNSLKEDVSQIWENIKEAIRKPIEDARDAVSSAIEKMKGFFNFEWSLPKIKLPHFSVEGSFSLDPPSIPSFGVTWYKKAMNNAMLLDNATIFGAAGGNLLGAGEAGPEVVSGAGTLMQMIAQAVRSAQSAGNVTININVNAANIQNDQELAERISEEMQYLLERRAAAVGAV